MCRLLTFALLATLLTGVLDADAQERKKRLYRWTDKEGKVHYSDHVPPEAIENERTEINQRGREVGQVGRALTPEEQAAEKARLAEEEAAKRRAEEEAKKNAILLGTYSSIEELDRKFQERFDLLSQSITSAEAGIKSQEKSLAELLTHAAGLERKGKPVPASIKASIEIAQNQVKQQREYKTKRESEKAKLDIEYAETRARYVELLAEREARQKAQP